MEELYSNFEVYSSSDEAYADGEFMWYDYFLFTLTLVIALGIGVYAALAGDKQRSTGEYLMGNRNLGVIPVATSMFMSYISAILVLGNTAEMYLHGINQWFAMIGSSFAYFLSGLIFVPLFFPINITSSFEYLEMRYKSYAVRITGTLLLMLSQIMYMGIAMYSPATALESVTPIPTWASIVATGIVGTIYTSIGGMKAVVWTDVFQGVILLGGLLAVMIIGAVEMGGLDRVWDISQEGGRTQIEWTLDPTLRMTFWSVIVGRTISSLQTTGTGQTSVQRYCALPTQTKAVWSVWLNIPFMLIIYSITCLTGLIVFAYYWEDGCDPLRHGEIDNSNQLLIYFIVDVLKTPGLPGLFVAVLFSGCLSSVSSSMNSLSAVTWKDMMEWKFYYLQEWQKALITKVLAAAYGTVAIGFAFMFGQSSSNVLQISQSFVSGVAGPLLGLFILASWFPWSNKYGALAGAWIALALNLFVIIGNYVTEPHVSHLNTTVYNCNGTVDPIPENPEDVLGVFTISFMWYSALGAVMCVIIGLIVSFPTGADKPSEQDPLLMVPFFDRLFCCLPNKWLRVLWCGVPYDEAEFDEDGHAIKYMDEKQKENLDLEEGTIPLEETERGFVAVVDASDESLRLRKEKGNKVTPITKKPGENGEMIGVANGGFDTGGVSDGHIDGNSLSTQL